MLTSVLITGTGVSAGVAEHIEQGSFGRLRSLPAPRVALAACALCVLCGFADEDPRQPDQLLLPGLRRRREGRSGTHQGTRIADAVGGVTDEALADAAERYDDDPARRLVSLIAVINADNRPGWL